jgi:hypothetical protein
VARKEDAEEIVDFAFIPVRAVVETGNGGHGCSFIRVCFHAQTRVVPDGEDVVDYFEAVMFGGVVDGGYVGDLGVFGGGVIFEEGEDGEDASGCAVGVLEVGRER